MPLRNLQDNLALRGELRSRRSICIDLDVIVFSEAASIKKLFESSGAMRGFGGDGNSSSSPARCFPRSIRRCLAADCF